MDLLSDPGRVASYLIDDEYREVGIIIQEVDIGRDDALDLFLDGGGVIKELKRNAPDELAEVFGHDDVEEFLLAAEVVIEEGQVDAGLFCDVAGAGGGIAILGEELFSRLHDLFFCGEVRRCGRLFSCGTAFFRRGALAGSRALFGCCRTGSAGWSVCFCHWFVVVSAAKLATFLI